MTFGFSPKYIQNIPLENLTPKQFLVLAIESAKKLDWNIGHISEIGFVAYTKLSMTSWSEEVKVIIEGNTASLKSECTGSQILDWGKNKKNIENLISLLNEIENSFTSEELALKYEELRPNFLLNEQNILTQQSILSKEKPTKILAIFMPTQGYFITPVLINLNIAIFVLMVISGVHFALPDNESLLNWGANFRPLTLENEWWRTLTSCFVHIGILHLIMNMYALLYIGSLLEPFLGKTRFAVAYLLTGIMASMISLWWHELTISAGASGAIFGMYGVFLAMLSTNFIEISARKAMLTSIAVFVSYNLINGMKDGVDNAAHIGGLSAGIIVGYAYLISLKKPKSTNLKYSVIGMLTVIFLIITVIGLKTIPNDIGKYYKEMKSFASMESLALEVYNMPENTPKERLLSEIKLKGLHYWNENIMLLNNLDQLNLPDELHDRNKKLLYYCELRIKTYNLIYKAVNEDTDKYKDSIEFYEKGIEATINSLMAK